jgi:hypothetical protein
VLVVRPNGATGTGSESETGPLMEERIAREEHRTGLPVFTPYRRGYDPDQVDRYVAEQSVRIEAANNRADEAERKLAAAVAQLREMHRRLTALESAPSPVSDAPSVPLDTLGEHIQRILSEAAAGADAVRHEAEREASTLKEQALAEGDRIVATARRKAESIGEELSRRRVAYLEKLEAERTKAVSQMEFLQEQRQLAVEDLRRVKALVDTTIAEVSSEATATRVAPPVERPAAPTPPVVRDVTPEMALASTVEVHRIPTVSITESPDPSELVRSHRAQRDEPAEMNAVVRPLVRRHDPEPQRHAIFDFDELERE